MNWKEVAKKISRGQTILVLGPNAIPLYPNGDLCSEDILAGSSFSQIVHERIQKELEGKIKYYYKRDELFLFENGAKSKAWEIVEDAMESDWQPDYEFLRKIVAIPFPIILNFSPDKHIYNAFTKYWRTPQFDYITTKYKSQYYEIDDKSNLPVIYNICGSVVDNPDSMILDHIDLFRLLQVMFTKDVIPSKGEKHFILLGFDMERWYFQTFLHLINRLSKDDREDDKKNYPIICNVGEDTRQFMIKQFNIEYFAPSREDFEQLYSACAEINILREVHNPNSPAHDQVKQLAANNNFEAVLTILGQHCEVGDSNEHLLLNLQGQYSSWLENKRLNIGDTASQRNELNSIRLSLLTLADLIFNK